MKTMIFLLSMLCSMTTLAEDNASYLSNEINNFCDDNIDKDLCVRQIFTFLYMANIEGKMAGRCEALSRNSATCDEAIATSNYIEKKFKTL
ncbi:hypothetical protein RJ498_001485 [Pluralibacter gergoviae]